MGAVHQKQASVHERERVPSTHRARASCGPLHQTGESSRTGAAPPPSDQKICKRERGALLTLTPMGEELCLSQQTR